MDHAAEHVVVEYKMSLDSVTILNLHVKEMTAVVVVITLDIKICCPAGQQISSHFQCNNYSYKSAKVLSISCKI